jgi:hypothetical protein
MQDSFLKFVGEQLLLEGYNNRFFPDPGVFRYAIIPRGRPNSTVLIFIVASIVHGLNNVQGGPTDGVSAADPPHRHLPTLVNHS